MKYELSHYDVVLIKEQQASVSHSFPTSILPFSVLH